jgi:hypothetical protein
VRALPAEYKQVWGVFVYSRLWVFEEALALGGGGGAVAPNKKNTFSLVGQNSLPNTEYL